MCTYSNPNILLLLSVTNQYSAALNLYLQAGAVCSDFFTKAVPPDVYTDQAGPPTNPPAKELLLEMSFWSVAFLHFRQNLLYCNWRSSFSNESSNKTNSCLQVLKRMIKCCSMMNCHTQVQNFSCPKRDVISRFGPGSDCRDIFLKPNCLLPSLGCSSLPVSPWGWLHDGF